MTKKRRRARSAPSHPFQIALRDNPDRYVTLFRGAELLDVSMETLRLSVISGALKHIEIEQGQGPTSSRPVVYATTIRDLDAWRQARMRIPNLARDYRSRLIAAGE